jgi:hypothetical protein
MRAVKLVICVLLCLLAGQGCERTVPKSELGNVIFELPKVPGGDRRPPTPEIDALPAAKDEATPEK